MLILIANMSTYKTTTVEKNDMNAQQQESKLTQQYWAGRRAAKSQDPLKAIRGLILRLSGASQISNSDIGLIDHLTGLIEMHNPSLATKQAYWAGQLFAREQIKEGCLDDLVDTLLERLDAHSELQEMDAGIADAVRLGCGCEMYSAMINKALESK